MNRLSAYSPNLKQSWMLAFILVLCQLVASGILRIFLHNIGIITREWASLSDSVLAFTVTALIIVRLGRRSDNVSVATPGEPLINCLCGMKRKAHGAQKPRYINGIVEVASAAQRSESPAQAINQRFPGFSPFLWFLLVPFIWSVSIATGPLTMWIPMPDTIKQMFMDMSQFSLPAVLLTVIIAPVFEEWFCRGIILKGLLKHYSPRKAIVWSAVIFSVLHLNPWQGISAFCGGLAIGWIYWRTRSLRYCIFMHAAKNTMGFIFVFIFPDVSIDTSLADFTAGYYIYAVALFACVFTTIGINKLISSRTTADMRN